MAKPSWHTSWKVLPHHPITTLEEDLREVTGSLPGMPLERRMTVARLGDGRLVIHNAICLEEPLMAELEAWGRPAFLVVPNAFHRLDALPWKRRYPGLVVIAGPAGRDKIALAVPVDGGPELLPAGGALTGEPVAGDKVGEMAFVMRHADGRATLVLNDLVFNQPHLPGFTGFMLKLIGSTGGPRVTRIMRRFGLRDRKAARAHLVRLSETPGLVRVIVSHGDIIDQDAAGVLRQAAERYL